MGRAARLLASAILFVAAAGIAAFGGSLAPLLIASGILCFVLSQLFYGHGWAPLGLHGAIWFSVLGLSALRLSPAFQSDWPAITWITLVGSEIAFVLGCLYTALILNRRVLGRPTRIDSGRTWIALVVLFSLGTAAFIIQIAALSDWTILFRDPGAARSQFSLPYVSYFYHLLFLIPALTIVYRASGGKKAVRAYVIAAVSLLFVGVTVARFGLLMTLGIAYLSYTLVSQRRRWGREILVLAIAATVFLSVGLFRERLGMSGRTAVELVRSGDVRLPRGLAFLVDPYMYAVGGFENFDYQLQSVPPHGGGNYSFRALYSAIGRDPVEANRRGKPGRLPFVRNARYNSSPYVSDLFLDFGLGGLFVGTFAIGVAASLLFSARFRSPLVGLANGVALYSLAMTFFSNYFTYLSILVLIVVPIIAHVFVARRSPERRVEGLRAPSKAGARL